MLNGEGPWHMGRSFYGHPLEDECPCPQEECGLVHSRKVDPECPQHGFKAAKTIRQGHPVDECPGREE
jgi:hypothetical protein